MRCRSWASAPVVIAFHTSEMISTISQRREVNYPINMTLISFGLIYIVSALTTLMVSSYYGWRNLLTYCNVIYWAEDAKLEQFNAS